MNALLPCPCGRSGVVSVRVCADGASDDPQDQISCSSSDCSFEATRRDWNRIRANPRRTDGELLQRAEGWAKVLETQYHFADAGNIAKLIRDLSKTIPGPSTLDYYAAKALQGFCANPSVFASNGMTGWGIVNCTEGKLASYCFALAEEMILHAHNREQQS